MDETECRFKAKRLIKKCDAITCHKAFLKILKLHSAKNAVGEPIRQFFLTRLPQAILLSRENSSKNPKMPKIVKGPFGPCKIQVCCNMSKIEGGPKKTDVSNIETIVQ